MVSYISNDFHKMINCVCIELYTDKIEYDLIDGFLQLTATRNNVEYDWSVPMMQLFGLTLNESINHVVATFRSKFKQVGV